MIVSLMIISIGFYGITSFVKIFECTPRAKIVSQKLPGSCVNVSMLVNASGLFNTITDYLILLLPVHAVRKLQMNGTRKILVVFVFTFGLWYQPFAQLVQERSNTDFIRCTGLQHHRLHCTTSNELQP